MLVPCACYSFLQTDTVITEKFPSQKQDVARLSPLEIIQTHLFGETTASKNFLYSQNITFLKSAV